MNLEGSLSIKGKNSLHRVSASETAGMVDLVFCSSLDKFQEFRLALDKGCLETVLKLATNFFLTNETAKNPNENDGVFTPDLSLYSWDKKTVIHGEWDEDEMENMSPGIYFTCGKQKLGMCLNAAQAEALKKRCELIIEADRAIQTANSKRVAIEKKEVIPAPVGQPVAQGVSP